MSIDIEGVKQRARESYDGRRRSNPPRLEREVFVWIDMGQRGSAELAAACSAAEAGRSDPGDPGPF
jgi:hypothetical protein